MAADASEYGIDAALLHYFPGGATKAVSHVAISQPHRKKEGLSRLIATQTLPDEEAVIPSVAADVEVNRVFSDPIQNLPVTANSASEASAEDYFIAKVKPYHCTGGSMPNFVVWFRLGH